MKTLLALTLFLSLTSLTLCEWFPCQQRNYTRMEYISVEVLAYLQIFGFDMCLDICERTMNCSYVGYDPHIISCSLMKELNAETEISDEMVTSNDKVIAVTETKKYEQCNCPEAATCTPMKNGGYLCVDLIDHMDQCSTNRYLVTGKYGVHEDRVSSSTVYGDFWYQLYKAHGWIPATMDQNQWIQVLFYRRKLVTGIVTKGLGTGGGHYYVSEYRIQYLTMSSTWNDIMDDSRNIAIFLGNSNWSSEKVNYLSQPLRTAGIRLWVVSWNGYIALRFDVLGC